MTIRTLTFALTVTLTLKVSESDLFDDEDGGSEAGDGGSEMGALG